MKAAYLATKDSAKSRNIPFLLTFEEFEYWAVRHKLLKGRGVTKYGWHIDRVRNNEGYHIDNIQILTNSQNAAKENLRRKWEKQKDYLNEAGFIITSFYQARSEDEPVELIKSVQHEVQPNEFGGFERRGWIDKRSTLNQESDEEEPPF